MPRSEWMLLKNVLTFCNFLSAADIWSVLLAHNSVAKQGHSRLLGMETSSIISIIYKIYSLWRKSYGSNLCLKQTNPIKKETLSLSQFLRLTGPVIPKPLFNLLNTWAAYCVCLVFSLRMDQEYDNYTMWIGLPTHLYKVNQVIFLSWIDSKLGYLRF